MTALLIIAVFVIRGRILKGERPLVRESETLPTYIISSPKKLQKCFTRRTREEQEIIQDTFQDKILSIQRLATGLLFWTSVRRSCVPA